MLAVTPVQTVRKAVQAEFPEANFSSGGYRNIIQIIFMGVPVHELHAMRETASTPGGSAPGTEYNVRTTLVASAVTVLAAVGLVLAVAVPLTAATVLVLGTSLLGAGRVADDVRHHLRRGRTPRRVCVPYAEVCVEV